MDVLELVKEIPSVGAMLILVIIFLRSNALHLKTQAEERAAFLNVIENHMTHDLSVQEKTAVALNEITVLLRSLNGDRKDASG